MTPENPTSMPINENTLSRAQALTTFFGGLAYGVFGASEPTPTSVSAGIGFSAALEYAGRPKKPYIWVLAWSGVVTGMVLREFLLINK